MTFSPEVFWKWYQSNKEKVILYKQYFKLVEVFPHWENGNLIISSSNTFHYDEDLIVENIDVLEGQLKVNFKKIPPIYIYVIRNGLDKDFSEYLN